MCASAHLLSGPATKLSTYRARESAMTMHFARSDETCPEHKHQPMIAAALIAIPVVILASVIGSLFGMA